MKSKIMLTLSLSILAPWALADSLKLESFDQAKLGELMGKMPSSVAVKSTEEFDGDPDKKVIKTKFPKEDAGLTINCKRTFYNNSPYPSYTKCDVNLDRNHRNINEQYDEVKIIYKNSAESRALFASIPYGNPKKEFYSYGRDYGTRYSGKNGNVFHYRISCTSSQCALTFSTKIIKN